MHGLRATAACEFVDLKRALGYTEAEARRELAMWLGHNPHRTEVTYAYVPRGEHVQAITDQPCYRSESSRSSGER